MSDSQPPSGVPGRYQLVPAVDGRTPMMVDTFTGRSWFRIAAGADHFAWRPMRYEPTVPEEPPQ